MAQEFDSKLKQEIKNKVIEKFQCLINDDLKKEIEETVRSLADKVIDEVIEEEVDDKLYKCFNGNFPSTKNEQKQDGGRVFVAQNSLLTDMLKISHIRTIYNISIVVLILLFLNTIIYDLLDKGSFDIGLKLITLGFAKLKIVIIVWWGMQLGAFLPYFILSMWSKQRHSSTLNKLRLWKYVGLLSYTTYMMLLLILPISTVVHYQLPMASSLIVLLEMVRFMMKSHAFIRSITPRIIHSQKGAKNVLPALTWYIYFLFAPTLVYKDSYPRTKKTNLRQIISRLIEVAAIILYINFLCERYLVHSWSKFGLPNEVLEMKHVVLTLFGCMLPSLLMFVCGFYLLLHSWHNAFAEILTFADRKFYLDWWNSTNFGGYYRTWNMVVHDWLYLYVYRDMIVFSGRRSVGTFFVFLISAVFHEIVLTFAFGFFYPILLVMFGVAGVILMIVTKHISTRLGNVMMWLSLTVGNGLLWCLYSIEVFARINCPMTVENKYLDLMIPRSWFCHNIVFTAK